MSNVEPDLMITPVTGKTFVPEGKTYDWIYEQPAVKNMCCVLQEQVFINYDGKQSLAKAKGVDWIYEEESPIHNHIKEGEFKLHKGDIPMAAVGAGLAHEMGIRAHFLSPIEIYYPSRTRRISMANPAASIESINIWPSCLFSVNSDIDHDLIILPIEQMRELLEYKDEVSAVEIRTMDGTSAKDQQKLQEEIASRLGPDFKVRNRFQQNESLYKMMKYEKMAIYMILIFVIIIIAFNIFGSLTMLMIEKREDIMTLRSMGAGESLIRRIFILEGWMISLSGLAAGMILGIGFSLLQQHFGFIKMPGHFVVQAYPIILSWSDILITAVGVALIGYLIALIPTASLRRR
jgi:ABC-type lipoprotein release transport system permease subunit